MAIFLGIMTSLGAIQVWHVLAISALTGFLLSFEQPIRQTILADVVSKDDLLNATSLYNLVFHGSVLFGPAIAGALIPLIGAGGCFFLNGFGHVLVLATILMIHIPKKAPGDGTKKSILRETAEVIVMAWRSPVFRSLFVTLTIISLFTKSYTQLMPVFARDILGVGAPGLGLLLMAPGAGAIVGGLAMASLRKSYRVRSLLMFLVAGFGVGLALFSASEIFYVSLFLLFLTGGFHTAVLSLIASLLQMHSMANIRGRVMGLFGLLNRGLGPMGAFPLGVLAVAIGAPLALAIAALAGVVGTAGVTLRKQYASSLGVVGGMKEERG